MTTASIQTIEDDLGFWVRIDVDGDALTPRGPFGSADEAEAMARRIAGVCRVLNNQVHWGATARKR